MIVTKTGVENITNQNMVEFELDNSNGQLFSVLSELYSKPEESTLRELATNCTDAHIMSGNQERPFIIKLPNKNKNIYNFSVRDFGPGLDHNQILNIYRVYGKSTKTNSNDQTGCLGLGSKSPFAISSTFYVKSFKNGICSQYTCSMGNDGIPQITDEPSVFETFEENGLEIIVPIYKEIDFESIIRNTLKHFKVKPLVYKQNGSLEENSLINIDWPNQKEMTFITKNIAIKKEFLNINTLVNYLNSNSKIGENEIIQLQIYYPIDNKMIMDTIERFNKVFTNEENKIIQSFKIGGNIIKTIGYLFRIGFQLHSDPGKIAFAPSRETVKYNETTLIYIIKELIKAAKVLEKMAITKLNKLKTYEDTFDLIYLGNKEIKLILNFFKTNYKNSIISNSEKIFNKIIVPKNFLEINNSSNFEKGLYIKNSFYSEEKINLNSFRHKLFPENYSKSYYIDIWDSSKLLFENFPYTLIFSLPTPFTRKFIQTMYKKIVYWVFDYIAKLYKEYFEFICFKTNDKTFSNYKYSSKEFLYSDSNKIEEIFKIQEKDLIDKRNEIYELISEEFKVTSCYDFLSRANNANLNNLEICKNLKKYIKLTNDVLKIISSYNANYKEILGLDRVLLSDCIKISDTFNLVEFDSRCIEISCAKVFNKLIRSEDRFKSKFTEKLLSCESKIVPHFTEKLYTNSVSQNKLPFEDLYLEKDSNSCSKFLAQTIMFYYFKFYPEEILKQKEFKIEEKDIMVKEFLSDLNIPNKYFNRFQPLGRYKKERKINSKPFDFDLNNSSESSKVKIPLYYFDFEINEDLINTLEQLSIKFLEKIKIASKMVLDTTYKLKKEKFEIHYETKISNLINYLFQQKVIEEKIKNLENPNIFIKYNNYLKLIYSLSCVLDNFLSNTEFSGLFISNLKNIDLENYEDIKNNYLNLVTRHSYFNQELGEVFLTSIIIGENNYLSIPDLKLEKMTNTKLNELFIYSNNFNVKISEEKANIFYERLISENMVCNLSDFKIGVGKDYICGDKLLDEKLLLKSNQKFLGDSKTKKIRSSFLEKLSFPIGSLGEFINQFYPEIVFISDNNFPIKYKKECINLISILSKIRINEKFISLNSFLLNYEKIDENKGLITFPKLSSYQDFTFSKDLLSLNEPFNKVIPLLTEKDRYKIFMDNFKIIDIIDSRLTKQYSQYIKIYIEYFTKPLRSLIYFNNIKVFKKYFPDFLKNGLTLKELQNLNAENDLSKKIKEISIDSYDLIKITKKNLDAIRYFSKEIVNYVDDEQGSLENYIIDKKNKILENSKHLIFSEFESKHKKFTEFLIELDRNLNSSIKYKRFAKEDILGIIKKYFKPNTQSNDIILFKDIENLITKLEKEKSLKRMHYKINRRTDKCKIPNKV